MTGVTKVLAGICLLACLAMGYLRFQGVLDDSTYKTWLAICSLGWFVFATYTIAHRSRS